MATCEAPSTPPRIRIPGATDQSQLWTPPLTGGFKRRENSIEEIDGQLIGKYNGGFKSHAHPVEHLNGQVTENYNGGKQLQPDYLCPVYESSIGIDTPPSSPSTETSVAAKTLEVEDNSKPDNELNTGVQANLETDQPFPFMRLPTHLRTRIYTLLLTVPGRLCARQNRTPGSYATGAYIGADERQLLPGISFVLHQRAVDGMKSRFARSPYTNVAILRASSEVYAEAREILYGGNEWEMANLTRETAPPVDFRVKLFPPGVSRMVRRVTLTARALYGFRYILRDGGYAEMKNVYRGLQQLTLVLEVEKMEKGIGRRLGRGAGDEAWEAYVQRVKRVMEREVFDGLGVRKPVPEWIGFKVMFSGDVFGQHEEEEGWQRKMMKQAVKEAFDAFKKAPA